MNDTTNTLETGEQVMAKPLQVSKKAAFVLDGAELVNMEVRSIPTLIDPILPKVGLMALIGTSDIGKSTLLLQLCRDIVLQDKFLGFLVNAKHRNTIYVSTEDDKQVMSNRMQVLKGCDEEKLKSLRFIFETENLIQKLGKELNREKADLVVIDTFSDIYSGDMNQVNRVRSFMNEYHHLAKTHQCAIIFNHHTGKNTEDKPPSKNNSIGSAGFEGKARVVFELRPDYNDTDKRHLCIVKGNYLGPEYKNSSFELDFDQAGGYKRTGSRKEFTALARPRLLKTAVSRDKERELVKELHKKGRSCRVIEAILNRLGYKIGKSTVAQWIKDLSVQ